MDEDLYRNNCVAGASASEYTRTGEVHIFIPEKCLTFEAYTYSPWINTASAAQVGEIYIGSIMMYSGSYTDLRFITNAKTKGDIVPSRLPNDLDVAAMRLIYPNVKKHHNWRGMMQR
jgi:hypothetical protein